LETLLRLPRNARRRNRFRTRIGTSDGGKEARADPTLTAVSYAALERLANCCWQKLQKHSDSPGMGPENLRTAMACTTTVDLQLDKIADPVLSRLC